MPDMRVEAVDVTAQLTVRCAPAYSPDKVAVRLLTKALGHILADNGSELDEFHVRTAEPAWTPQRLHDALDLLVAQFISDTGHRPSIATVMQLMEWSAAQLKGECDGR